MSEWRDSLSQLQEAPLDSSNYKHLKNVSAYIYNNYSLSLRLNVWEAFFWSNIYNGPLGTFSPLLTGSYLTWSLITLQNSAAESLNLTNRKILLRFPARQRNNLSVVWIEWADDFIPKLRIVKYRIPQGTFGLWHLPHGELRWNEKWQITGWNVEREGKKHLILKCVQGSQMEWSRHGRDFACTAGLYWKHYSVPCEMFLLSLFLQIPPWGSIYSKHSKSLRVKWSCP